MTLLRLLVRDRSSLVKLALAALLAAMTYQSAIGLMALSAWLISRAAQHPDASSLTLAAVGVRALGLSRAVFRYGERVVGHSATLEVVAGLRVAVFEGLVRRRGQHAQTAQVLSAVVADVEAVQDLLLRCLLPFASGCLVLVVSVTGSWLLLPTSGLVLLGGLGAALLLVPALGCAVARSEVSVATRRADYQSRLLDITYGCADLLVHGGMTGALAEADAVAGDLASVERRGALRSAAVTGLMTTLQGVTVLGVTLASLHAVATGALSPVLLAVTVLVALASFEPIASLAEAGGLLPRTTGAARRVSDLLAPAADAQLFRLPGRGTTLTARDVGIRYAGARRAALAGVDLDLRPGMRLAVVGPSGAGKSTLLALLAGLERPDVGDIWLGGVPVTELSERDRARLAVVAEQSAHVFHSTVADNLRLARPDAQPAEMAAALVTAGMDGWLNGLPLGLDSPVGEHGSRLSGGERKRITVARAVLSGAPVVLLDEPTEGLDPVAADVLVRRLVAWRRDGALILVTHRLTALDGVDEVLVLDQGRVVQQGPPGELRERPGPFRDAYLQQVPDAALVG